MWADTSLEHYAATQATHGKQWRQFVNMLPGGFAITVSMFGFLCHSGLSCISHGETSRHDILRTAGQMHAAK